MLLPLLILAMLEGKKIILGITGSIAAYKAALLVRLLVKGGADVQVIMTPAATTFVAPLTFSTLSRRPVLTVLSDETGWTNHVELGRWADLMVIAPASAHTMAKMSQGLADNLLTTVYLSAACPVMIAPAMDVDMWSHPATRQNVAALTARGNQVLAVESGELASGLTGEGRMLEPELIAEAIAAQLGRSDTLAGQRALVTAGPTYEPLDPVRFIGNHASGKMGIALALELASRGCSVDLVLGPSAICPAHPRLTVHGVTTAEQMHAQCLALFPGADITLMAAAVADYRPVSVQDKKIKKDAATLSLSLEKTPDILKDLGGRKQPGQFLGGFALETDAEEANALKKLEAKHLDMIVLNSLREAGAGFRGDTNKVTIFTSTGTRLAFPLKSKAAVARDIVEVVIDTRAARTA